MRSATLVEFLSPPFRDRFQIYIFCQLSGFSPFVRLPSTRRVFHPAFQSHRCPSPPRGRGRKNPSYINNVAKCRRNNNDLTAVRRSAFYRRCSRSGSFAKIESNDPDAGILSRSPPFVPNRSGVFARLSRSIALVLFHPVFPGGSLSPGAVPSLCYRAFLTPITRFFKSTTCSRVRTAGKNIVVDREIDTIRANTRY